MRIASATLAAGLAALTAGCVSANSPGSAPSNPAASPTATTQCDLLTVEQLQRVLGVVFVPPRAPDPSSTTTTTVCQWTATDQTALVITKLLTQDARLVFRSSFTQSQRTVGPTERVRVPGASAAYRVPSLGRTAMLVGDRFVEVSVLVPTATPEQVADVAALAARSARTG